MKIRVEVIAPVPVDKAWQVYTSPEAIKQWNAASDDWHTVSAAVDLREGGTFSSRMEAKDGSMGFDFAGTYTRIIPHQRIEYVFGERGAEVEFTPVAGGTRVCVTFDGETTYPVEQQRQGWQAILDRFASYAATA